MNTLISMILTIAFTRISVPSEPTLAIFSTHPVSLSFSFTRNSSLNVSASANRLRPGSSSRNFINDNKCRTAIALTSSRESCDNKSTFPILYWFSSLKRLISNNSCISLSLLWSGRRAISFITPAKFRLTKSSLISFIVLCISLSLRVSPPTSCEIRRIISVYRSLICFW